MKVIIVGGVAGGASCAARLRRLDETAEILMVERGPYVSYANCGLPYHVGGVIPRESSLLVADERVFREQFAIDVRTRCEAIAISPAQKTVDLRNVVTGEVTTESYDKLVLSPGAAPISPPLPGIDLPGVFRVRTVPDVRMIREWIEGHASEPSGMDAYTGFQTILPAKRAVVVGGGFIGLEMAENMVHLGLQVTLVQRGGQLLGPMDPEMARYVERYLAKNGVRLELNVDVSGFKQMAGGSLEVLDAGRTDLSGRPGGPRHRRAPGKRAGEEAPGSRSVRSAGSASMIRCIPATRTSSRSAMPSRSKTTSPANGRSSRWRGRPTGRAASRPM